MVWQQLQQLLLLLATAVLLNVITANVSLSPLLIVNWLRRRPRRRTTPHRTARDQPRKHAVEFVSRRRLGVHAFRAGGPAAGQHTHA